eukprot:gene41283-50385_t
MDVTQLLSALLFCAAAYPFLLLAFAVLAAALAAKLYYDASQSLPVNYYSVMEVPRQSEMLDIRRAYKTLSKKYHPDKNPGIEAELMFQSVKNSYDVLMDEQLRDSYNRFGPGALDFDPRKDELKLISDIAIQYVFWGVLSFIFTLHSSAKACRVWLAIVLIAIMSTEVCFSLTSTNLPVWMLPNTLTEYELIFFLHAAYPAILAFLAALSMFLY